MAELSMNFPREIPSLTIDFVIWMVELQELLWVVGPGWGMVGRLDLDMVERLDWDMVGLGMVEQADY